MKGIHSKNLEEQIVFELSQVQLFDEQKIQELLEKPLDWAKIKKLCEIHGVGGLLYQNLLPVQKELELNFFENIYFGNVAKCIATEKALQPLLESVCEANFQILIYKGLVLIKHIYKKFGLRGFADVDILVRATDLPQMQENLLAHGYMNLPSYPHIYTNGVIDIDLHTDPFGFTRIPSRRLALRLDVDRIWQDVKSSSLFGPCVVEFSTEDELLILTIHAIKHSFQRLIWFVDITEFLRVKGELINWDLFLGQVKSARLQRPFFQVFNKLENNLIPQEVLKDLDTGSHGFCVKLIYANQIGVKPKKFSSELIFLSSIERLSDKLIFLKEIFFPEEGKSFAWAYYPVRFVQILIATIQLLRHLITKVESNVFN